VTKAEEEEKKKMSFASDELDESQITAMDLPLEFKVNKFNFCYTQESSP
jgi:hypothetical protein